MTRERPILFNGEMVRAILAGTKTVTRRPVRPMRAQADWLDQAGLNRMGPVTSISDEWACFEHPMGGPGTCVRPPCWEGDLLYVRESARVLATDIAPRVVHFRYEADGEERLMATPERIKTPKVGHKMPNGCFKEAARIWLKVTSVRVERIQDLGAEDVFREGKRPCGVGRVIGRDGRQVRPVLDGEAERTRVRMISDFATRLWDATYGNQPGLSWNANPWVWVIEFERVEAP